ncbi:MAG: tetratricopeptide repeat protein [Planctomycetes bacterium]|nr:tetratricopeptide repeat protein [Planctomycetota bacterium]
MGLGKKKRVKDKEERREDALRPSSYLGYNHDALAVYFVGCKAYAPAESEFRRAIWLNPFEAKFKAHLALCLLEQNRVAEARDWIAQATEQSPDDEECRRIRKLVQAGKAV